MSETGVTVGIEEPFFCSQRSNESIVEPASAIIFNDLAVAAAGKMREFVKDNECGKFGRYAGRKKPEPKPNVPGGIVSPVDNGGLEDALYGGKGDLGIVAVNVERIDSSGHPEQIGLTEHEAHFRIRLEQRDAAIALPRCIERADLKMAIEAVRFGDGGNARDHRGQVGHRGRERAADERKGRCQLGVEIGFRDRCDELIKAKDSFAAGLDKSVRLYRFDLHLLKVVDRRLRLRTLYPVDYQERHRTAGQTLNGNLIERRLDRFDIVGHIAGQPTLPDRLRNGDRPAPIPSTAEQQ